MKSLRQLSSEEARSLDAALASLSERAKHQFSLNRLLQQWSYFVSRVEQGYEETIYEYINDLSSRDALEEVLLKVPPSLSEKLLVLIQPLDERFNNVTQEVERPLLPSATGELPAHWWFRVPKMLGAELENDLRSEGHIR